jgi:hypothetical protein
MKLLTQKLVCRSQGALVLQSTVEWKTAVLCYPAGSFTNSAKFLSFLWVVTRGCDGGCQVTVRIDITVCRTALHWNRVVCVEIHMSSLSLLGLFIV